MIKISFFYGEEPGNELSRCFLNPPYLFTIIAKKVLKTHSVLQLYELWFSGFAVYRCVIAIEPKTKMAW